MNAEFTKTRDEITSSQLFLPFSQQSDTYMHYANFVLRKVEKKTIYAYAKHTLFISHQLLNYFSIFNVIQSFV